MFPNQDNTSQPAPSNEGSAPVNASSTENKQPTQSTLFAGKYKTVEDLEKGYQETGKYVRDLSAKVKDYESKIPKAPENYAFDFSQDQDLKDINLAEDAQVQKMLPIFKELGISQDQANRLVSEFIKSSFVPAPTIDDFKKALGADADVKMGRLQIFNGNLPEKDQAIFKQLAEDPQNVEFLYRYLLPKEDASIPSSPSNNVMSGKSSAQMYDEAYAYRENKEKQSVFGYEEKQEFTRLMNLASAQKIQEEKK